MHFYSSPSSQNPVSLLVLIRIGLQNRAIRNVTFKNKIKQRTELEMMSETKTQQLRLWFLGMFLLLGQRPQYEII